MPAASAVLWACAAVSGVTSIALLLYLDLRLHALKQSGDLPASTPRLFGIGGTFAGVWQTVDLPLLYSRRYRDIDTHTRRLVPIIRVTLPLTPVLVLAAALA